MAGIGKLSSPQAFSLFEAGPAQFTFERVDRSYSTLERPIATRYLHGVSLLCSCAAVALVLSSRVYLATWFLAPAVLIELVVVRLAGYFDLRFTRTEPAIPPKATVPSARIDGCPHIVGSSQQLHEFIEAILHRSAACLPFTTRFLYPFDRLTASLIAFSFVSIAARSNPRLDILIGIPALVIWLLLLEASGGASLINSVYFRITDGAIERLVVRPHNGVLRIAETICIHGCELTADCTRQELRIVAPDSRANRCIKLARLADPFDFIIAAFVAAGRPPQNTRLTFGQSEN